MRKKAELSQREVILYWMLGRKAERYSIYTEGINLYSYDLIIGGTYTDNSKYIIDKNGTQFTWSQLRHLDIVKNEFALLANANDVYAYLQQRLIELKRVNNQNRMKEEA